MSYPDRIYPEYDPSAYDGPEDHAAACDMAEAAYDWARDEGRDRFYLASYDAAATAPSVQSTVGDATDSAAGSPSSTPPSAVPRSVYGSAQIKARWDAYLARSRGLDGHLEVGGLDGLVRGDGDRAVGGDEQRPAVGEANGAAGPDLRVP